MTELDCKFCKQPIEAHQEPCAGMLSYRPPEHVWPDPINFEALCEIFKFFSRAMPNATAEQITSKVTASMGVSIHQVMQACALVQAMDDARASLPK